MSRDEMSLDEWAMRERAFAQSVKVLREERGWSQADLAGRLREQGFEGVNQVTVSRIEGGSREIRLSEAEMLARIFDRPLEAMRHPDVRLRPILSAQTSLERVEEAYEKLRHSALEVGRARRELYHQRAELAATWQLIEESEHELHRRAQRLLTAIAELLAHDPLETVREGLAAGTATDEHAEQARELQPSVAADQVSASGEHPEA